MDNIIKKYDLIGRDKTDRRIPFEILDSKSAPLRVIDCFLSNYEIPLTVNDVCEITGLSTNDVEPILENILKQKIIKQEKELDEKVFLANFRSPKTMGLFQYYRAFLDENLEKLAYNKIDLK